jgi:two-component system, OmpR family, response regulator
MGAGQIAGVMDQPPGEKGRMTSLNGFTSPSRTTSTHGTSVHSNRVSVTAIPRILLVDDEAMVRENLAAYLVDEGFDVIAAASAEEGIDLLRGFQEEGQVNQLANLQAVVDMRLPGMSGEDFIRQARKISPELRCLIHTGSLEYTLPADLREQGMCDSDILHKPIADLSCLADRLNQ